MSTSRTEQEHQRRTHKIAADAAAAIAADSPVEEEVLVTVEERPPTNGITERHRDTAENVSPFRPEQVLATMATLAMVNVAFVQQIAAEQVRFAARVADALAPSSR